MTSKERIKNILEHKAVDRVGTYEHFWTHTQQDWEKSGQIPSNLLLDEYFDYDMSLAWALNMIADLDYVPEILQEDERTIITRDGNGAVLKKMKNADSTPEHIAFGVQTACDFIELLNKFKVEDRRIDFKSYRYIKEYCQRKEKFFCCSGLAIFELMHSVMGHENLLVEMLLDPETIEKVSLIYADNIITLLTRLFKQEGLPDAVWFYEDLGFKEKPFIGNNTYKSCLFKAHKKLFDFVHSLGLKVIMHSCGYIETYIPLFIEAGLDCLQAMEVKAGTDVVRIAKTYGDKLSLIGGMDVRVLESKAKIKAEIDKKLPEIMKYAPYILHTDHSIPPTFSVENYKFFLEYGKYVGTYKNN